MVDIYNTSRLAGFLKHQQYHYVGSWKNLSRKKTRKELSTLSGLPGEILNHIKPTKCIRDYLRPTCSCSVILISIPIHKFDNNNVL